MLDIEDLTVSIGEKTLLKNISLSIAEGETRMLFGENGSGKTSLLMAIMGLGDYKVETGRIMFKGEDITSLPTNERAQRGIGIMFQRPPTITGLRLKELLELIEKDGRDLEELKRAELLQLMTQDPDLVLLDEPESGVDLVNIDLIGNAIRKLLQKDVHKNRHKSGLIITHSGYILDYVEADKGCVLVNDTIWCTGNPHEILQGIRDHGYQGCLSCQK
jgi:Fe-S cluster assembly ATP-binding protein